MPTLPNQTLLTVQEAADLLKVSAKTMRRWEAKGILIPIRTEGGHRRYSVAALQAYKKGHKKGRANKEKITTPAYAIFRQDVTEQPKINQGSALSQSAYIKPFDEPTLVKKSILEPSVKLEPLKKIKKTKSANSRNQQNTAIFFASLVVASVIAFQKPLSQEISNITKGNKKPQLSFAGFQIQKILPNVSLSFFNRDNSGKLATNTTQKPKFSQVLAESISTNDVLFKVSVDGQFEGDLQVDGGNLTTRATDFNIFNENANTINIGGEASSINIGANTGTTTIQNNLQVNGTDNDIAGTLNLSGNTLSSTGDLLIDSGGGGVSIGTGTATDVDLTGDDLYVTGDIEVDGTSYIPTLAIGGDIFTDLTGTGLQVSSGVLETTLGTSITSSEIDDGTIAESDLNISNSGTNGYLLSYNSSTGGFTWVTAATDSGFTDAGTIVTLTTTTDNVNIGGSTDLGKLAVDGDTDEIQLLVQGNSTQTSNLITAEQSDGTDVFTVDNSGNLTLASGADLTIGSIGLNDVGSSNTTSGAYLIGVYDELTNSNATNLQDVLDDLDAAITGGATGDITAVGDILSGEAFTSGTPGSTLFFADNGYLGLGASAGRIEFDDQVTDEVNILGANVGIGTSTPGSKLEVSDGTDSLQIAASGDLTFVDADGAASITGPAGGALSVLSGSSQSLILGDAATGSNNGTVSIFSSDWEISSTGAITGVSFDANGSGNSITNIESADIADNTLTAADLAATLTFADGDLLDLSAINVSSATEGILVPQSTSCASGTANGQLCWDNDTFALYVGNGTSATLIGGTGGGDITSVTAGTGLSGGGSSGDVTLDFDSTELGNLTWGSGSGFTWTFDASAGTDTTLAFGNNSITATTGTLNLTGTLDLGTNTISDGNFNGNWGFNSGNATGIGNLAATGTIDLGDAAADTISLTGSLDTGINFLDADSSSYSIAGADASTATGSAGNLTVRAGAGGGTSGNGGNLVLSGGTVTSGTAGYISLETGGSERLRVAADGTFLFEKGSNDLGLAVTSPTGGSWTLTIPALTADADLCTTLGNCAGVGGGVTESGTQADTQIAYFTSDGVLSSSSTFTFDVDGTTGNIFGLSNATVTTGNLASLASTSLTTGNALDLTATYVDATGGTDSAIDINLTNNPSVSANTLRGIDIALTDAGALANTVYGLYVNAATANANDTEYAAYLGNGTDALQVSSVGDLTFVDADGAATITGPAGGALSVLSGASQSLILGDAATGSNNGTVSIFSSDWEISSTGAITGVSFDANGSGNSITNIESADIADDTIVNADINSAAAIAYSKLNLSNSIVTGDITDNTLTASDLAATLTFSDSDLVNLSAINVSSTSEGLIVPQATSCSSGTANGQLCWDNDTFALYIGNGSSAALVGGTGTGDITSVTAGTGLSGGGSSGDVTLDFDSTELGNLTWGSGSGFTWTFNAGATDPTIAFASDQITYTAASNIFSGDITVQGGTVNGASGESLDLGVATADTLTFSAGGATELTLDGTNLNPGAAEGNSLGSTSNEWEALYLGDNNGAFFGLDQDWSLGYDEATDDRLELVTSGTSGLLVSSATVAGTGFLNTFDSLTTGTGLSLSLDALTSGTGVLVESAGSNTITGDLFRINIGSSVTATGDLFTVEDNGSQLFGLNDTQITSALPHQFTAAGDVAIAYDIQLTNQTASYIKSNGPLYLEAGESFENNNLSIKTYGTGDVVFDNDGTTTAQINDDGTIYAGSFTSSGTAALCWDNSGGSTINDCSGAPVVDYAEIFPTEANVDYAEIVSLGNTLTTVDFIETDETGNPLPAVKKQLHKLAKATAANSKVIGVTSRNWSDFTSTGHNNVSPQDNPKPIALSGRVPVKVSNTSVPINPGDMIGASSVAGQAQKSSGGYVVGQALESWQPNSGKETVLVFVNPNYYLGSLADNGNLSQQFDQIATTSSSTNQALNLLANTVAIHENDLTQLRDLPNQVASISAELDLVKETLRTAQESGSSLYDVNQDSRISEIENRMLEQDSLFSVDSEGYQLLSIDRANFTDLTVLGDTILGDTVINGKLNVGTIQIDNIENSIDAIGTLKIQPLALGSIEFMGGLITFDTEGNAKVNEITANKYKVAGASAGTAVLPPNQTSIFIPSTAVTSESLIFVTAKKAITIPLAVTFKSEGTGFTVGLTNAQSQQIDFDWWIVDKVEQ